MIDPKQGFCPECGAKLVEKPLEGEVFYYCKDEGGWQRRGITCGYA